MMNIDTNSRVKPALQAITSATNDAIDKQLDEIYQINLDLNERLSRLEDHLEYIENARNLLDECSNLGSSYDAACFVAFPRLSRDFDTPIDYINHLEDIKVSIFNDVGYKLHQLKSAQGRLKTLLNLSFHTREQDFNNILEKYDAGFGELTDFND